MKRWEKLIGESIKKNSGEIERLRKRG